VIEDTLTMCRDRLMRGKVQFNLEFPGDAPDASILIAARTSQISQILLNLLNNALDACERLPGAQVWLNVRTVDERVEIRIWDNGPGVPRAVEDRIMQPFFTTKPNGKGTGLGLSISLGIAREHHGNLELDRTVADSCFVLSLPRRRREEPAKLESDETLGELEDLLKRSG
jgi:two-component system sensor histidine kinase HupT/HoxJ